MGRCTSRSGSAHNLSEGTNPRQVASNPLGSGHCGERVMLRAAATFSCLLFLTTCNKLADQRTLAEAFRENSKYVSVAVDAVKRLRDSFNAGKCNLIYVEASEVFRQLESRDDWLTTCEQTRASLGSWVSLNIRTPDTGPSFVAHVDGTAVFSSGSYRLSTAWNLENGRAKLFRFCLEGNVVVPRSHLPLRKLIDPPPSRFAPVNT
jgi:hypothetical protein